MHFQSIKRTKTGYQLSTLMGNGDTYSCNIPAETGNEEEAETHLHKIMTQIVEENRLQANIKAEPLEVKALNLKEFENKPDTLSIELALYYIEEEKEIQAMAIKIEPTYAEAIESYIAFHRFCEKYATNKLLAQTSQMRLPFEEGNQVSIAS